MLLRAVSAFHKAADGVGATPPAFLSDAALDGYAANTDPKSFGLTVPAGTNRALFVFIENDGADVSGWTMALGGQALTAIAEAVEAATTHAGLWRILEAGISARSNDNLVVTQGTTWRAPLYARWYENVEQAAPEDTLAVNEPQNTSLISGSMQADTPGSIMIHGLGTAGATNDFEPTIGSRIHESSETSNGSSLDVALTTNPAIGSPVTVGWSGTGAGLLRLCLVGCTIAPAPPPPPVAADILGATFWLRAEDADLTLETGDRVSAAVNMGSAAGMDLAQATDASRPTKIAAELNGKAVLRFDGGDWMESASVAASAFATAQQNIAMYVIKQTGTQAQNTTFAWESTTNTNRLLNHATYANTIYWDSVNTGGGRLSVAQPTGWDDAWHIVTIVRDGANAEIRVDGVSLATSANRTGSLDTGASAAFMLGQAPGGLNRLLGDLAEFIFSSGADAVDSTNIAAAEAELAAYYGITLP